MVIMTDEDFRADAIVGEKPMAVQSAGTVEHSESAFKEEGEHQFSEVECKSYFETEDFGNVEWAGTLPTEFGSMEWRGTLPTERLESFSTVEQMSYSVTEELEEFQEIKVECEEFYEADKCEAVPLQGSLPDMKAEERECFHIDGKGEVFETQLKSEDISQQNHVGIERFHLKMDTYSHDDTIASLLITPFGKRSEADRRLILNSGRPRPNVNCVQVGKTKTRNFSVSWYSRYSWLCGSSQRNSLFCWPCLLVSVKQSVWNTEGFHDWKNLSRGLERHQTTKEHIQSVISVKQLSKKAYSVIGKMKEQEMRATAEYNAKVAENREVFKHLIDLTCVLCRQELPFRGHDESDDSLNSGNYREMFDLMLKCSEELKSHWQKLGAFNGMPKTLHNDIIDCIREEMESVVYESIKNAKFFSIQVDKTMDRAEKSHHSVIFRFVNEEGRIMEHFLGLYEVSAGSTAEDLYQLLVEILEKYDFRSKLVAQTYDGASVMSSELNGLQAKIRMQAPQAIFTHCFAHPLSVVLQQSCCNIPSVKAFYATLQGIPAFFHKSSKRRSVFERILGKRIPTNSEVRCSSDAKILNVVFAERSKLIEVFEELMNSKDATEKTVRHAEGYRNKLSQFNFVFYLFIFKDIFCKTENLSNILQKKSINIQMCVNQASVCQIFLRNIRCDEKLQEYIDKAQVALSENERQTGNASTVCKYRKSFFEIIDNITTQIDVRFSNINSLEFLQLANSSHFSNFPKRFPQKVLTSLSIYEHFFDKKLLQHELETVYARDNENLFYNVEIDKILERIVEHDLCDTLPQTYKLFSLIATIPSTTTAVARNFSCLKRVKTCLENNKSQEGISRIGLIFIEKELIVELMNKSSWHESIIKRYASKKDRRLDLLYK